MEINIMSIKLYIKEVISSFPDENGAIVEQTSTIGEAWVHKTDKLTPEQRALVQTLSFDICLKKNAQEELVTELDYLGNEHMVMRPVRIKAFSDNKDKAAPVAKSNPKDVLKAKMSNGKTDVGVSL